MSRLRNEMDARFAAGRDTALRGIPANAGACGGKDARYYDMAYYAGYETGLGEIERMSRALKLVGQSLRTAGAATAGPERG